MPQLDFLISSSQIFWSIVIFLIFYTILTHFFLPNFIKMLKTRKKIVLANNNQLINLKKIFSKEKFFFDNVINMNLIKIKVLIKQEIFLFFKNSHSINLTNVNKSLINVLYSSLISYDINILKSIDIKPVF